MASMLRLFIAALLAASCYAGDLTISVVVDQMMCATGDGNCAPNSSDGAGHTYAAPAKDNHNSALVLVQVLDDGMPVTGLTSSDVTLVYSSQVVPSGGPFLTAQQDCGPDSPPNWPKPCFVDFGNGMYFLRLHPVPTTGMNWKSGQYTFQIKVRYTTTHPKLGPIVSEQRALARIGIAF